MTEKQDQTPAGDGFMDYCWFRSSDSSRT